MLDIEEIKAAILEASQGKRSRRTVAYTLEHLDEAAQKIQDILFNGWTPRQHPRRQLKEGGHKKLRNNIQKPAWWPEQIIHHLMVRQLKPIIMPRMAENICGTAGRKDQQLYKHKEKAKGKGALYACKKMQAWRDQYNGKKFYVLETDIKSFYDSIDLDILMSKLRRRIRDKKFLDICEAVLRTAGPGIPKGFYTSPWFAQLYLEDMDEFILQSKFADHYVRYMDNMFLLGRNKRQLRKARDSLEQYLQTNLGLHLNKSTQVYRFEYQAKDGRERGRPINCVGFSIHCNRVSLRKSILKRIRAKARRIARRGGLRLFDARAMMSYKGWLKHADVNGYYQRHVKPWVDLRSIRQRISKGGKQNGHEVAHTEVCSKTA